MLGTWGPATDCSRRESGSAASEIPRVCHVHGRGLSVVTGLSRAFGVLPASDGSKVVWALTQRCPRPLPTDQRTHVTGVPTTTHEPPTFTDPDARPDCLQRPHQPAPLTDRHWGRTWLTSTHLRCPPAFKRCPDTESFVVSICSADDPRGKTRSLRYSGDPMTNRAVDTEALLTPAEVAQLFRVDPKTVTRWAKAGKLTSLRTLGGHRRYRESEVRNLLRGAGSPASDTTSSGQEALSIGRGPLACAACDQIRDE